MATAQIAGRGGNLGRWYDIRGFTSRLLPTAFLRDAAAAESANLLTTPRGVADLAAARRKGNPMRRIAANGLKFACDEAGSGPDIALCLHGFPESRFSWRNQLPLLANAGWHAVAPDLRG